MNKYVQIVRMRKLQTRWFFVAHGAVYDRKEANELKRKGEEEGDKFILLPVTLGGRLKP